MTHAIRPVDFDNLKTMTYEVTGRIARITFNRPEKGNAIIADVVFTQDEGLRQAIRRRLLHVAE